MKKRILISICAFILCFTGGCANDNSEGNKNELGNYITFQKVSTAKNIEIMKDVTINITATEHGGHLRIENGKNLFPSNDGELLGVIAKVNNQSNSSINIKNFLNCKEGSVFMVDENYYPVSNYHVEGNAKDGIIQPNEEKTVYIYTEVPFNTVTDLSLLEVYLTYGKETKPFCAINEEDLNGNTTQNGFHFQLQWSTLADDMW